MGETGARPSAAGLLEAMEATWPPAETVSRLGWRLNRGAGGGKRVSAAVREAPDAGIGAAEEAMRGWGQPGLFRLTPGDGDLDAALEARGYGVIDPVVLYLAPVPALTDEEDETARIVRGDLPVASLREIWAAGGIGAGRLAVMDRAAGPKCWLMARQSDRPAGAAFVACHRGVAIVNAIEVAAGFRRRGVGREIMHGAANLAADWGAGWLALAVTEANGPARGLYEGLGMEIAARYHYRIAAGDDP